MKESFCSLIVTLTDKPNVLLAKLISLVSLVLLHCRLSGTEKLNMFCSEVYAGNNSTFLPFSVGRKVSWVKYVTCIVYYVPFKDLSFQIMFYFTLKYISK